MKRKIPSKSNLMKLLITEQDMVWIGKSYHKMLRTKYNKEDTVIIKSPCSETLYNSLNNFISKSHKCIEKESLKSHKSEKNSLPV